MTPLRKWFEKQRVEYKKIRNGEESNLTTQRMQLLHDIEFQFVRKYIPHSWDERFEELVEFKSKVSIFFFAYMLLEYFIET